MIEHPAHLLHEHVTRHWAAEHETARAAVAKGGRSRWWAMAAIAPAILISAFDMTTLNVALPALTKALRATTSDLQWIIDSYTIVLAGLLLFAQGVGDRFGRKGVYLSGLALFGLASASAAFATTPAQLILARAVMGVGAALLLSPTLAMIAVIFSPEERPRAVAIWVIFGGVGIALGPVLGGLIVDTFGWGGVFLINVPVVIAAFVLSVVLLPNSRKPGDVHLDVFGALLSVAGLATLLYGVIEGPHRGWFVPATLGAIIAGGALTVAFFVWELRSEGPMFDPRVFTNSAVVAGATGLFVNYISFMGMFFLIPQYLQFVEGHSALVTGLLLLPFGLAFIAAAQLVPMVTARFGARTATLAGMVAMAAGLAILALIDGVASYGVTLLGTIVFGAGVGISVGPATTIVVNALPVEKAGDGSSVNLLMRQSGAAFGVAIIGSVFASAYAAQIAPALLGFGPGQAEVIRRSIQGAETVATSLAAPRSAALLVGADRAFLAAARDGLLVASALAAVGAVIAALALRRGRGPASS